MGLEQKFYSITDLENLSASVLYTGHLPPMGPGGFGLLPKGDSYGISIPIYTREGTVDSSSLGTYAPPKLQPRPDLTMRDFPASGFQLHIHEGVGGITHFKHGKNYSEINSYDAAMADGGKPAYDAMEDLNNMLNSPATRAIIEKIKNGN
ncbi:hypothetical protein A3K82_01800 [Candidatus Pacearchaeota archaeon RBG_19FT_COMBO_34_9]|nr:MAG: hypothetical protein A3K82_01800 [Candidatus Pacearchaeota archaeon RBG_19FT_COMBO_34_9]OGJ16715.1 MAG: hypothetical protein A3K74_00675 [Candidatus Pacearchaeota archaeon RBG_13_33_26]